MPTVLAQMTGTNMFCTLAYVGNLADPLFPVSLPMQPLASHQMQSQCMLHF